MIVVSPDEGILGEFDWLYQSEDSEVVEPVGLLVEWMNVIPADKDCQLSPVPPGDRVLSWVELMNVREEQSTYRGSR